jgi:aryl-alcohol dehydrogenase-like predicted oxidoreductase/NAD-dependent dihydropyrimidine dehydrogenase PreA subunit
MVRLGRDGPLVSRFCLGLLPLSPLQSNLPRRQAITLLEEALAAGVTFFDTAEIYRTYSLVAQALRPPAVVATKAYAYSYSGMRDSLRRALSETARRQIDIFLLHEQESRLTLAGHAEALRCLVEAKAAGLVGAVGVSTHAPEVVCAAADMAEIDIIHPLVNHKGLGLLTGTLEQMLAAIAKAADAGKGIYAMKILGGGHLAASDRGTPDGARVAFDFIRSVRGVQAVAVGVKTRGELLADLALLEGRTPPPGVLELARAPRRQLFIEPYCEGCGRCVAACGHGALRLIPAGMNGGDQASRRQAGVDPEKCVLCGYCAAACRGFYIKVV